MNRKTVVVLNLIFFGWLALAVIGAAYDATTVVERAASQRALMLD